MIAVLDTSAVVELLLGTRSGMEILKRISDPKLSLYSPELVDIEVLSTLRRYELTDIIPPDRIAHLSDLDLRRHPHGPLRPRIWSWRYNLTPYDAALSYLGRETHRQNKWILTVARAINIEGILHLMCLMRGLRLAPAPTGLPCHYTIKYDGPSY